MDSKKLTLKIDKIVADLTEAHREVCIEMSREAGRGIATVESALRMAEKQLDRIPAAIAKLGAKTVKEGSASGNLSKPLPVKKLKPKTRAA